MTGIIKIIYVDYTVILLKNRHYFLTVFSAIVMWLHTHTHTKIKTSKRKIIIEKEVRVDSAAKKKIIIIIIA